MENIQQALDSSRLQPQALQPTTTSASLNPTGYSALNHARASGGKRAVEAPKLEADTISDKATAAFIRRTLCSHDVLLGNGEKGGNTPRPIDELLPPLTSSNDVDLQLYGIISVIIKEFVQTWYSKITPDHVFINEVIQVIAHCTRALEQRLRKIDLESLLLDEVPGLLEEHLIAFRLARRQASSSQSLVSDPRLIYHTLCPHPALSPVPTDTMPTTYVEQRESESAWRQLIVQGILAVLLPTDDLNNGCLRSLVAEIFAEMIMGNGISGKACEGWLLWEAIGKIADILQTDPIEEEKPPLDDVNANEELSRLERFGLLPSQTEEQVDSTTFSVTDKHHRNPRTMSAAAIFWLVVHYTFFAYTALRALVLTLATASSLPSRFNDGGPITIDETRKSCSTEEESQASTRLLASKRPIVSMKLWSCAAQFVELDVRMPWLTGFTSMLHCGAIFGPGRVGDTDGVLDRRTAYSSSHLTSLQRMRRPADPHTAIP
ncbi:PXA domain-containing protein [Stagonosporopsis vannaccii]|nr:PXA domain-containing protein [Stagonosporopsis vannaccii]